MTSGIRDAFQAWVYRQYRNNTLLNRVYEYAMPFLDRICVHRIFDRIVRRKLSEDGIGIDVRLAPAPSNHASETAPTFNPPSRGVNVIGNLNAPMGAGELSRQFARCLGLHGHPFATINIELDEQRMPRPPETRQNPYPINLFFLNVELVPTLPRLLGTQFFHDKYNIGFWAWEQSAFPDDWIDRFEVFDEIWVATDFVKRVVADKSSIPVVNVGVHIRCPKPPKLTRRDLGWPSDKHVFLNVFDPTLERGNIHRKNPDGLIRAYQTAFAPHFRDTLLVVKTHGLFRSRAAFRRIRAAVQSVKGILIDEVANRETMDSLFHSADAYVSLHRGEGFGLPMAEMMMLGKPVIATNHSGNTDFMTSDNSYLIPCQLVEVGSDGFGPRQPGALWADPNVHEAAALMTQVVVNRAEAKRRGDKGRADVMRLYSHEAAYRRIDNRLAQVMESTRQARTTLFGSRSGG